MLRREAGETITATPAREVVLLADGADCSITWSRYAAGERGQGLHVHHEHTDAFYVLQGEVTFAVGPSGEPVRVGPGGYVAVPPDVAHGFANESAAEACWLNFHAPDKGFAQYLRDARDGNDAAFDSFDPPPGGGRPGSEVVVRGPGELAAGDLVAERPAADAAPRGWVYALGDGRVLVIGANVNGSH